MRKMTVAEFKTRLTEEIGEVCRENGWDTKSRQHRGEAFQLWCARRIAEDDARFDNDPSDTVVGGSRDLGIDLVFHDSRTGDTLICQCKWTSWQDNISRDTIEALRTLHDRLATPGYVGERGNRSVQDALPADSRFKSSPSRFTYRLITNARLADRVETLRSLERPGDDAPKYEIWDRDELKRTYLESASLDDDIPDIVSLDLPRDGFIRVEKPRPGIVAVLRTNALRNLWDEFKNGLYAQNIRGGLNSRLNDAMRKTLAERASEFFYFNNGISAICTEFSLEGNRLQAKHLQVINGAQTLNAIGSNPMMDDGRVLFRLTKTPDITTDSGIGAEIIRYNNTQNAVHDSDFRSNDQIQKWLRNELEDWRWPAIPKRYYVRKRESGGKGGIGRQLKLEDLGKIRYAWLHEPMTVCDSPRVLFQDPETGGHYVDAFGVDGNLQRRWPKSVLGDALLAVWCYDEIDARLKKAKRDDPDRYSWLPMHRWHLLSLGGEYVRLFDIEVEALLHDRARCETEFESWFGIALKAVLDAESRRARDETDGRSVLSMRNWRRSGHEWAKLKDSFLTELNNRDLVRSIGGQV